ncbi:peptidase inhibitor family I36 protein [Kitasatospora sp. NPDC101183]|uniref:peptidase inhibitor family I36 protein n=1 Tax=Kitasatospora sp. NPDC101183 TaxID=3364100 RepID=UPI00381EDFA6
MKLHALTRRAPSIAAATVIAAAMLTGFAPAPAADACEDGNLCLYLDYDANGPTVQTPAAMSQCIPGYVQWQDGQYSNPLSVNNRAKFGLWVYNSSDCSGKPQYIAHAGAVTNLRAGSWSFYSSECPQDKVCFFSDGDLTGEQVNRKPGSSCDNGTSHGSYSVINNSSRPIRMFNSVFCTGAYTIGEVPAGGQYLNSGTKITGWKNI